VRNEFGSLQAGKFIVMAQEPVSDVEVELALFEQLGYHDMLVHLKILAFANCTCTL
jgi:hypothetical protein